MFKRFQKAEYDAVSKEALLCANKQLFFALPIQKIVIIIVEVLMEL